MIQHLLRAATMLALSIAPISLHAQTLRVWTTTDVNDTHDAPSDDPGDPWTEAINGQVNLNLAIGEKIWVATLNDDDLQRNKFWSISIRGALTNQIGGPTGIANGTRAELGGFQTGDDTQPVAWSFEGFSFLIPNRKDYFLKFTPQPQWERVAFSNDGFAPAVGAITVVANSVCSDLNVGFVDLDLSNTSFGASGAMQNAPLVTEFWLFPKTHPVDFDSPPALNAPPATGVWSAEPVSVDPDGNPHPTGVKFSTLGPGLAPTDHFDVHVVMTVQADSEYQAFSFAPADGEYLPYRLTAPPVVPLAGPWMLGLFTIAIAGSGAAALRHTADRNSKGVPRSENLLF